MTESGLGQSLIGDIYTLLCKQQSAEIVCLKNLNVAHHNLP